MIELYSHGSPNGHKISIALEELGLAYKVHPVNVFAGEGQAPEYLKLNPNGKVPAIRDGDTGQVITESNAILLYLAEKAGKLVPQRGADRTKALELLFFQASTLGAMFGQRAHFGIMAPETIPYAIERYEAEGERLHQLVDGWLASGPFFLGEQYSIVDIAFFGWFFTASHMGFGFDAYPNLSAWFERVAARPAVARGVTVPSGLPDLPPRKNLAA